MPASTDDLDVMDDVRLFMRAFRIPRQQARLLMALCKAHIIVTDELGRMFGTLTNGRSAIYELRKSLKPYHFIEIENSHGVGYWLTNKNKDFIRSLVTAAGEE